MVHLRLPGFNIVDGHSRSGKGTFVAEGHNPEGRSAPKGSLMGVGRGVRLVAAAGVTLALAAAGCSGSSAKTPIGTIADVGFRPSPNGFTFQNYGDTLSDGSVPTNLTVTDVRSMFGDGVCVSNQ